VAVLTALDAADRPCVGDVSKMPRESRANVWNAPRNHDKRKPDCEYSGHYINFPCVTPVTCDEDPVHAPRTLQRNICLTFLASLPSTSVKTDCIINGVYNRTHSLIQHLPKDAFTSTLAELSTTQPTPNSFFKILCLTTLVLHIGPANAKFR
jgi:hypothetical protein